MRNYEIIEELLYRSHIHNFSDRSKKNARMVYGREVQQGGFRKGRGTPDQITVSAFLWTLKKPMIKQIDQNKNYVPERTNEESAKLSMYGKD